MTKINGPNVSARCYDAAGRDILKIIGSRTAAIELRRAADLSCNSGCDRSLVLVLESAT